MYCAGEETRDDRASAPAILFSPDSAALSEAGGASAYSAPRGMLIFWNLKSLSVFV